MANPQLEDGYTSLANDIMDHLAGIRVPGEARQVLDFILRKTYGWHKKEDPISLTQFEKATGLKRANVVRSLKTLLRMNIIYKGSINLDTPSINNDTTNIQVYGFQKDFDSWRVVSKQIPSIITDTEGSIKSGKRVVSELIHTKDKLQKKTNKRKVSTLSDEEWLEKIKPLYPTVDVEQEINNCKAHFLPEEPTRRRILNWLKIAVKKNTPFKGKTQPDDAYSHLEVIHHGKSD